MPNVSNDDILYCNFRLNLKNPQHLKIAKVLNNLNLEIYKSKNQFIVDAVEFYIDHYGSDHFSPDKRASDQSDIAQMEMEQIKKELKAEIINEAKNEVIRILGSIIMAPASNTQINLPNAKNEPKPDDVVSELVTDWD